MEALVTSEQLAQVSTPPLLGHADVQDFNSIRKSFKFWAIILGLGITLWLAALENSVLTTAAPKILEEIPLGDNWIWLTNAFFLCNAAFQPLLGQLSNLFGRRLLTMGVVSLFILGSGICGGANTDAQLIVGRAIQGIGSGGIGLAFDTIVSDLVPLRYRGNYIAIILLIYSVGTTTGALIGGLIVDHWDWRWCFWLNLPIGGLSLIIMFFCLNVKHRRDTHWTERLKRIDIIGNLILIGGTVSIFLALTYAGTRYPWGSWHILVPLVIGFAAIIVFGFFEASLSRRWTKLPSVEPVMPPHMFATRTSIIVGINTFLYTAVVYWAIFFLPVYFQSVLLVSATQAGINIIPVSLLGIPAAAAAAAAITRWGKYKVVHLVGFALFTLGLGLWSLMDENTSTGEWIGFMFIGPVGAGLLLNSQLPAFQAPVPEAEQGTATATWNFIRAFGSAWGVAIPAAIFSNRVDSLIYSGAIADTEAASFLRNGGAYQYASAKFVHQFQSQTTQTEIQVVYRLALQRIFQCAVAFAGASFLLCILEKDIPLRKDLVTDFGLNEDDRSSDGNQVRRRDAGEEKGLNSRNIGAMDERL
ncbi:hypothetical protein NUW58_g4732 [Xylaria curta]|uniref:Uncharacterized protein n=1 Tax=Xylaria curta TaxID=42375 RepID=A0ACC1P6M4_9PEZI|nr:hypothetical protein NUW58_g4732 [Xylaria curta]